MDCKCRICETINAGGRQIGSGTASSKQEQQHTDDDDRQNNVGASYLVLPIACFLGIVGHLASLLHFTDRSAHTRSGNSLPPHCSTDKRPLFQVSARPKARVAQTAQDNANGVIGAAARGRVSLQSR